ncbi:sigma-54-dependent Fis family transcriptional regulator [bacterium]|nr:sigma-54-dependent Fis family transcriptional regulator [bacterium]
MPKPTKRHSKGSLKHKPPDQSHAQRAAPSVVLNRALHGVVSIFSADRGFIVVRDGLGFKVVAASNLDGTSCLGEKFSRAFVREACRTERAVLSTDPANDPRFDKHGTFEELDVESALGAPLLGKGKPLGVIVLHDAARLLGRFTEQDRLALEVGVACELALLLEHADFEAELARASAPPERPFPNIRGSSKPLLAMFRQLEIACRTLAPVIVLGETGTGKELVAQAIHDGGARAGGPYHVLNCSLNEQTVECELFGSVEGAFTGAKTRDGAFKAANGGTLFLDELGEMPLASQAKFLRILQDGMVRPLGTNRDFRVDVRIVAATNRELAALVAAGKFREDLYHRLKVMTVKVPPLRERGDDIVELARFFIKHWVIADQVARAPELSEEAIEALREHPWRGNVRELSNVMRAAVGQGKILIEVYDLDLDEDPSAHRKPAWNALQLTLDQINAALEKSKNNRTSAAKRLGMSRQTLYRKTRKLNGL